MIKTKNFINFRKTVVILLCIIGLINPIGYNVIANDAPKTVGELYGKGAALGTGGGVLHDWIVDGGGSEDQVRTVRKWVGYINQMMPIIKMMLELWKSKLDITDCLGSPNKGAMLWVSLVGLEMKAALIIRITSLIADLTCNLCVYRGLNKDLTGTCNSLEENHFTTDPSCVACKIVTLSDTIFDSLENNKENKGPIFTGIHFLTTSSNKTDRPALKQGTDGGITFALPSGTPSDKDFKSTGIVDANEKDKFKFDDARRCLTKEQSDILQRHKVDMSNTLSTLRYLAYMQTMNNVAKTVANIDIIADSADFIVSSLSSLIALADLVSGGALVVEDCAAGAAKEAAVKTAITGSMGAGYTIIGIAFAVLIASIIPSIVSGK
ncbi:MAG: hypothetical protein HQK53_00405 [Oligoflexia bacterium]|nr:hypothetical protein [Oligoflexia bacterium]